MPCHAISDKSMVSTEYGKSVQVKSMYQYSITQLIQTIINYYNMEKSNAVEMSSKISLPTQFNSK